MVDDCLPDQMRSYSRMHLLIFMEAAHGIEERKNGCSPATIPPIALDVFLARVEPASTLTLLPREQTPKHATLAGNEPAEEG